MNHQHYTSLKYGGIKISSLGLQSKFTQDMAGLNMSIILTASYMQEHSFSFFPTL